jgi:polysaccharide pyruvyl transferase WcaK-like protein
MSESTRAELEFFASSEPEATFCRQLERMVRKARPRSGVARDWRKQPFRPLLLGYNGKGNVGADLRVREIIRQMRVVLGHVPLDPLLVRMDTVMLDPLLAELTPVRFDGYFPDFIEHWLPRADGVIACEGTMFTSKFSDILSATFAGAIALAARSGELAIAYGAESGSMSAGLSRFVQRAGQEGGLVLSRSRQTHEHLRSLGVASRLGADTAWTYDSPEEALRAARGTLEAAGWDGRAPVAVVCPMDPFCWPIRVDFDKARALREQGLYREQHYAGVMFHSASEEAQARFQAYLAALRQVLADLAAQGYFPILIGMEKLDGRACARLNESLPRALPAFVSGSVPARGIVALLHSASMVVTSRFHAAVLSLNACVRTVGIALDERIRNLFSEAGLEEWFVRCDAEELGDALVQRTRALRCADMTGRYEALVRSQIEMIGHMGMRLHDEIVRVYGDFPPAPLARDWRAHLPPLSARLEAVLQ